MKLLTPLSIKNLELKNRVVCEPMCMYSVEKHDGMPTDFHLAHYTSFAIRQVGYVIVESTGVLPEGRITDACLGIWSDAHIEPFKRIVDAVHQQGSKIGIQLGHAGRKCTAVDGIGTIMAPSSIAFSSDYRTPQEMSLEDIETAIQAFVDAAIRADHAGFDAIELHGAHGYLINQFYSPTTNKRTDAYGDYGRFLHEVVNRVSEVWPKHKVLQIRISNTDYETDGYDTNHVIEVLKPVSHLIDIVNVSSGGVTPIVPPHIYPGYQIPQAIQIKQALNKPVIGCGLLNEPALGIHLVETDQIDLCGLARPLLRNPNWVLDVMNERTQYRDQVTTQYKRGYGIS